jgi:predicted O-linked N-acetylglucosamine transferase (SPINDLY family)
LNNFRKVNESVLRLWCRILQAIPESRLLLHAFEGSHRERVRALLRQHDIHPDRVTFVGFTTELEYLRTYALIDLALDPFPYGGGTTTCDALWMGVPVVSLAGATAMGRAGLSILSNIGLPELVARDADQYSDIAVALAGDCARLRELRATLRRQMQWSPLMDAERFAHDVEAAYAAMWRHWCGA